METWHFVRGCPWRVELTFSEVREWCFFSSTAKEWAFENVQVNSFSNTQFACSKGGHTFSTLKGFPLVPLFCPKVLRLQGNSFLRGGVTTLIRDVTRNSFSKNEPSLRNVNSSHSNQSNEFNNQSNEFNKIPL